MVCSLCLIFYEGCVVFSIIKYVADLLCLVYFACNVLYLMCIVCVWDVCVLVVCDVQLCGMCV